MRSMAHSTVLLKFLGTSQYALDVMLTYPRVFIRHVFNPGDSLDVTYVASPAEMNRSQELAELLDPARPGGPLFQVVVTAGSSDIDGSGVSAKSLLVFGSGAADAGATDYMVPGSGTAGATELKVPVPRAGTLRNLFVKGVTAPGAMHSDVFTVRVNGMDTGLTCTVSGTATTANDSLDSVSVAAGDQVSLKIVQGASSAGADYQASIEYATA
jgi:hypothetical protein